MVKSFMFTVFIHLFNKGVNLNLQGCKDFKEIRQPISL
jgi:hypothetical protein